MNTVPNLKERLAGMNDAYRKADDGTLPEDGDYQALVQSFDFFEARDQVFLKTVLVVQHDDVYEGREVECVHNLEDPDRLHWAKKHLRTLGLPDLDDLGDLETQLHEVLDVPVAITIKTSDRINESTGERYRNVYVNEKLGPPLRAEPATAPAAPEPEQEQLAVGGGQPSGGAGAIADDDIPFAPSVL